MARRAKHQTDQRADLRGGGFVGLPGVVHRSEAYRSLPVFERAVLTEIIAAFNGYNNGKIVLSQRQISDALGNTNFGKIGRAIAILMERGLIDVTAEGEWKPRKAREYRLTFVTSGAPPYTNPATNDYLRWQKIGADTVSAESPQSADTVSAGVKNAADTVSAGSPQKPQKCVNRSKFAADTVSSLIVKPYQGPFKRGPLNGLKHSSPDLDGLRNEVETFLSSRDAPDVELLAGWAGVPLDTISSFLRGGGLSDQHRAALPEAMQFMTQGEG